MTGAELRKVREALDLTQAGLAVELGTTTTTVYRWESGRGNTGEVSGAGVPLRVYWVLRRLARRARVRWPLPGRAPKCETCGR